MLDYDIMMFRAIGDAQDEEYRTTAQRYYRPYIFSYVAEITQNTYNRLKELQKNPLQLLLRIAYFGVYRLPNETYNKFREKKG